MKEWQVLFEVKGLVSPIEGITFNDEILIKRAVRPGEVESDDISQIFFRIRTEDSPSIEEKMKFRKILGNILHIYALIADRYTKVPLEMSAQLITYEYPFGSPMGYTYVFSTVSVTKEQLKRYTSLLIYTMNKYQEFKTIFELKSKSFMRNAIVYYYRAMEDLSELRLEEALIDLMIALESLLSKDPMELRYRLSLRTSLLLSIKREEEQSKIYEEISELYKKRNLIVHGIKKVDLSYEELYNFQKHVRTAIFLLLHFNKPKKTILDLLDRSITNDKESQEELKQLSDASSKETNQ